MKLGRSPVLVWCRPGLRVLLGGVLAFWGLLVPAAGQPTSDCRYTNTLKLAQSLDAYLRGARPGQLSSLIDSEAEQIAKLVDGAAPQQASVATCVQLSVILILSATDLINSKANDVLTLTDERSRLESLINVSNLIESIEQFRASEQYHKTNRDIERSVDLVRLATAHVLKRIEELGGNSDKYIDPVVPALEKHSSSGAPQLQTIWRTISARQDSIEIFEFWYERSSVRWGMTTIPFRPPLAGVSSHSLGRVYLNVPEVQKALLSELRKGFEARTGVLVSAIDGNIIQLRFERLTKDLELKLAKDTRPVQAKEAVAALVAMVSKHYDYNKYTPEPVTEGLPGLGSANATKNKEVPPVAPPKSIRAEGLAGFDACYYFPTEHNIRNYTTVYVFPTIYAKGADLTPLRPFQPVSVLRVLDAEQVKKEVPANMKLSPLVEEWAEITYVPDEKSNRRAKGWFPVIMRVGETGEITKSRLSVAACKAGSKGK